MDVLGSYIGPLLGMAGVIFQFAIRQFKVMNEAVYWCVAIALTTSVWVLTSDTLIRAQSLRLDTIHAILWIGTGVLVVRGASSGTDAIATKAVEKNPNLAGNMLVPKSNSL